jgi:hypothetical protein
VREASRGGLDGWMALVYPKAFGQSAHDAFDAAYPGPRYLGLPCGPVIQVYDDAGPALVREQVAEAKLRGAASLSIYVVETASDDELRAVASAKAPIVLEVAAGYQRGAIAILDHGTPAELRAWGDLFTARVPR